MQELEQWEIDAIAECVAIGEHFKATISRGGFDVCFNCGSAE